MIKGIVFDLDGTLLNTVTDIKLNLNETLKKFGYNELTDELVKSYLGNGSKALVLKATNKDFKEVSDVVNDYIERYSNSKNEFTKPYEGISELISTLKDKNIKIAITSNKMQKGVTTLNNDVFGGVFDVAIGESEHIPVKPNPAMVFEALNQMGLEQNEVLFIGDTEVDLLTAKNANVKSIGVTWGFRTKEFLETLSANYIVEDPSEILKIINDLNKE